MQNNSENRQTRSTDSKESARKDDQKVKAHDDRLDAAPADKTTDSETQAAEIVGVVTDCMKLNVRKEPKSDADVVTIIPALSKVTVDMGGSTDTFYKVHTVDGAHGFCMRKFIALSH